MPMTRYVEQIDQWEKYFKQQADYQLGKISRKDADRVIFANAAVGGGVTTLSRPRPMTKVTTATAVNGEHGQCSKQNAEPITLNITSPVEATVDQAKSEMMEAINAEEPAQVRISKETAKRAASVGDSAADHRPPAKKARGGNKKGAKKSNTKSFNDVFSGTKK